MNYRSNPTERSRSSAMTIGVHKYTFIHIHIYYYLFHCEEFVTHQKNLLTILQTRRTTVAAVQPYLLISRLLGITGLFCKKSL